MGELLASGEVPAPSLPRKQRRLLLTSLSAITAFILGVTILIARANDTTPPPAEVVLPNSAQRAAQLEAQYEREGKPSLLFEAAEAYYQAGDRRRAIVLYQSYRERMPRGTNADVAADRIWELNIENGPDSLPSPAAPAEQGRQRMEEAQRKFDVGKYQEAARLYESAYELTKDRSALLQAAESSQRADQKRLALMYFEAYQRETAGDANAQNVAAQIAELRRAISAPSDAPRKNL